MGCRCRYLGISRLGNIIHEIPALSVIDLPVLIFVGKAQVLVKYLQTTGQNSLKLYDLIKGHSESDESVYH